MKRLTFIQAEAAARLTEQERIKWARSGMHVLRRRWHGKNKWKAVTADWQIKEAKRQQLASSVEWRERLRLSDRRMSARAKEKLITKSVAAALAREG